MPAFEDESDLLGGVEENEDDNGEELFGDNMEADYRPMPELDRYDRDGLDDSDYEAMSEGERAAAEAIMRKRDREEGRMVNEHKT